MKVCPKCGENKPLSAYSTRPSRGPDAVQSWCRECVNAARRDSWVPGQDTERARGWRKANPEKARKNARRQKCKQKGLTLEQYDAMREAQNGLCAICKNPDSRSLSIDHDHSTGKVRALLCGACNRAIGWLKDDPVLVRAAADYLERHA